MLQKLKLSLLKKIKTLPLDTYAKIHYEYYNGKKLNLENPVEFNEKIQWMKVYFHPPILNKLVDKYAVREYVEEKVGAQYLNDLISVYDKASDVDFNDLPNQFVIKGAHGCHYNLIVRDKNSLNKRKAQQLMRKWMRRNYYYKAGLEWAYKDVTPKLVAEKFLEEKGKTVLNDYKIFCFNGTPKFIQVDLERSLNDFRCYYDTEWNKLPFYTQNNPFYEGEVEKPENLEEMIVVAKKLADNFPFVRVDLYSINGKTIFGEMTFYPADARKEFIPEKYNKIIGDYMMLPTIPKGKSEIITI